MEKKNYKEAISNRVTSIRIRTWTLTLAIIVALVFTFLVSLTKREKFDVISFVLVCAVQIIVYCIYFPDGELYGEKDDIYISNKNVYNEKAGEISSNKRVARLRNYCDYEFSQRIERYIENECAIIGITRDEFNSLKGLDRKYLKKLETYTIDDKTIYFTKRKVKRLYNLIYGTLPVEKNSAETIMSAVENDGVKAISDGSVTFKKNSYVKKFFTAIVIGGVFGYIGYETKNGIGLKEITSIIMYLTSIFSTAVMSYTSGETCSRVYKSRFYVDLINYIDSFNEWNEN